MATDALAWARSTELRKPLEMPARFAASASPSPVRLRRRWSFGPSGLGSADARPVRVAPSSRLMPGTFRCWTSRRYLIRFRTLSSSGLYSLYLPLLRTGATRPTDSQSRSVDGLTPRMRAVWPTVRKPRREAAGSRRRWRVFDREAGTRF